MCGSLWITGGVGCRCRTGPKCPSIVKEPPTRTATRRLRRVAVRVGGSLTIEGHLGPVRHLQPTPPVIQRDPHIVRMRPANPKGPAHEEIGRATCRESKAVP